MAESALLSKLLARAAAERLAECSEAMALRSAEHGKIIRRSAEYIAQGVKR